MQLLSFLLQQNSEVGSSITQIMATDADSGNNGRITFSTVATSESMPFSIDDSSGVLQVAGLLDRETVPQYLVSSLKTKYCNLLRISSHHIQNYSRFLLKPGTMVSLQ